MINLPAASFIFVGEGGEMIKMGNNNIEKRNSSTLFFLYRRVLFWKRIKKYLLKIIIKNVRHQT